MKSAPSAVPQRVTQGIVSASVLPLLGVRPQVGRVFAPEEDALAAGRAVVLGDALWRGRFGADPQVVGRIVTLDGSASLVVGVMPPGFQFPVQSERVDLWTTVAVDADPALYEGAIPKSRGYSRYDGAIARLRAGATLAAASAGRESNWKPGGITPTTRAAAPSRVTIRPTTWGSAPNRPRHSASRRYARPHCRGTRTSVW